MCGCCDAYVSCLATLLLFNNVSHLIYFKEESNRRADRFEATSCCVYINILTISAAFILQDQSKLSSQGFQEGKTCNMCTVNWKMCQHWPLPSSRWSATDHISTSKADTYRKPHVSEPRRFKAWPSSTHQFFFSSKISRVQSPPNTQTQTYTFQPFLSRLSYSVQVFERVSEQVQRCNCYHLETRNVTGDRLARTNWNHYSPVSLVPVKLWVCRNVVSYCIQACAPPNHPEPL